MATPLRAWRCTQRRGLASQMPVLLGEAWSGEETYLVTGRARDGVGVWVRVRVGTRREAWD